MYDPSKEHTQVAKDEFQKLRTVRSNLISEYHREFMGNLLSQAIDKKDRYKRVKHDQIKEGDIVLLVEPNTKRYNYPMGRIVGVEENNLGEVTSARVIKGGTREVVYRHATSIIPLMSLEDEIQKDSNEAEDHATKISVSEQN